MENKKAIKLVDKIVTDLDKNGINKDTLIDDLKSLREFALEEQIPLVVKVLRYTYEHIEENDSFLIPIPDDEPVEEDEEATADNTSNSDPVESLKYLVSLTRSVNNKTNVADLREYRDALKDF
ncbi:hypothetical protein M0D21_00130 [Aquimarina sp. D1M17]|uniref:hypothetical protein n=1 Tax=Aquimarina acroporae TaxID=2937283 RepID=UPI0020BDC88B|nr:hypothetical protein [Aquimarina acroporae]MCK8519955.1 hypothetical protein [Aquimarina acroporae]